MTATSPRQTTPTTFADFFDMGMEESTSPFIKWSSRQWGANLTLKASLVAAVLLLTAFTLSFYPTLHSLSNLLLALVYFLAGIPSLIESIEDLADFEVNIDVLMTLAAFSSVFIGSGMEGALLLVLFALSGSMEDAVTNKAKSAISSLNKLAPTIACVVEPTGKIIERAVADVRVGDIILVRSGQLVPLDGVVVDGVSSVNLVHLTGENLPVTKKVGDEVPAGANNMEGALTLNVLRTSSDSTLSRIIKLVTNAQEAKPQLQRWFNSLSRSYALSIIGLALLFACTFPFIFNVPFLGVEGSVYRALTFLIAASPCALIIAIPIAYLSAISCCARQGILLKGGVTLDALARCHAIALDKTGTITKGELTLEKVEPLDPSADGNELTLAGEVAYTLERQTHHPIAQAVNKWGEANNTRVLGIKEFNTIPGYGVKGTVSTPQGDREAFLGRAEYVLSLIDDGDAALLKERVRVIQDSGHLLAVLWLDGALYLLLFSDIIRPGIAAALAPLRSKRKMRILMLTGDHADSAKKVAEEVGVDEYYADLKPEDKLSIVAKLSQKQDLAMVGDGINDAPALARATVGIAMGKVGSGAAIEAADIVLLQDDIDKIDWLVAKAQATRKIVKENLALAAGAILIASLPALGGVIPLWLAVVMHEGGTVFVGLNALRLLRK